MPVAELPSRLPDAWSAATRHPFLTGVRDGSVTAAAFDTWLAQDGHFVADLVWFQARLLARAPRPAQAVLAGGAVALVDELAWFETQAALRGLPPDPPQLPATEAYAALLARLDAAERLVSSRQKAFLLPGAPAYRDFVAHWTTPQFVAYVAGLERAADELAAAGEPSAEAVGLAGDVLTAERAFWDMATEGT